MSNEQTLQQYNEQLENNNNSLDNILEIINELPEAGEDVGEEVNSYGEEIEEQGNIVDELVYTLKNRVINAGAQNNYSTEEQVIGTYINGEPLYRKVITGPLDGSWSEENTTFSWIDLGVKVDKVPRLNVSLTRNEEFTYTEASNKDIVVSLRNGRGGIATTELQVGLTTSMFANQEIDIIIEYTKATE